MSLLYYQYLTETTYSENSTLLLCVMLVVGILAQSGGFFLHMMLGREGERSWGTVLTFCGAPSSPSSPSPSPWDSRRFTRSRHAGGNSCSFIRIQSREFANSSR